jgi:hypothetical protein
MENHGTKFLRKCRPQNIEKLNDGKLKVSYKDKNGNDCYKVSYNLYSKNNLQKQSRGRHGRDHMVIGFTTTYVIFPVWLTLSFIHTVFLVQKKQVSNTVKDLSKRNKW